MTLTLLAIDGRGAETAAYLALLEKARELLRVERAKLLTSDATARHREIQCVTIAPLDYLGYSRFCVERLAEHVETEHCLCMQLDGFVINPERWDEAFLAHDYVGAPWVSKRGRTFAAPYVVGNGGFSLRSQRFLRVSAEQRWHAEFQGAILPRKHWGNEDYFLCVLRRAALESAGVRFAPVEVARRFSLQSGDVCGPEHDLEHVFGFHGPGLLRKVRRHLARRGISYAHL